MGFGGGLGFDVFSFGLLIFFSPFLGGGGESPPPNFFLPLFWGGEFPPQKKKFAPSARTAPIRPRYCRLTITFKNRPNVSLDRFFNTTQALWCHCHQLAPG